MNIISKAKRRLQLYKIDLFIDFLHDAVGS